MSRRDRRPTAPAASRRPALRLSGVFAVIALVWLAAPIAPESAMDRGRVPGHAVPADSATGASHAVPREATPGGSGPDIAGNPPAVQIGDGAVSEIATADLASTSGAASASGQPAAIAGGGDAGPLVPSVEYEDELTHAADRISFRPGDRVSVPFTPRASDGWPVGGQAPRVLPGGRVSGAEMARSAQGSVWTSGASSDGPATGDRPSATRSSASATASNVALTSGEASSLDSSPTFDSTPPVTATVVSASPHADLSPAAEPQVSSGLRRQVFGFLPYWELSDSTTSLDYNVLTTIAYFSVGIDSDGNLQKRNPDGTVTTGWSGWTSSTMTGVINAAHARGTRVVLGLTLFGWTTGKLSSQAAFLDDPAARRRVARQAAAAVRDRGADGINVDIEPLATGHEAGFVSFIRELRTALNSVARGYQLTFDTLGRIGNYPIEDALGAGADALFVMGYDYRTASADQAGSIAPLSGPVYDVADTLLAYLARVPASKVILGVPYYGRAWSTVSSAANAATQPGSKFGPSASVPYGTAIPLSAQYGRRWDSREQVPWFVYQRRVCTGRFGCVTSWREVYYEDATSLGLKYDLINRYGIRGAGIWALGYEGTRRELNRELVNKFIKDTTPPVTGIKLLPAAESDEGFVVDWTARDDFSKVSSFDVQVSVDGGPWKNWLTGTGAGAEVWLGRSGHAYAFRARGRDAKGNLGAWEAGAVYVPQPTLIPGGFGRAAIDNLSVRAAPSTTASRVDTLPVGTIVAITRGPVIAGGYAWYEVVEPVTEWAPVALTQSGVWVAAGPAGASATFLEPVHAPNSTAVAAGIRGFSFSGAGATSVGAAAGAVAKRAFSPNGDGSQDLLRIDWTDEVAMSAMTLNVYRTNGSLVESRRLGPFGAGQQTYAWDGKVRGSRIADGTYLVQLVGTAGGRTYHAPSARPVTSLQVAAYGVRIDTIGPTGRVSVSTHRLSPNGDGRLDSMLAAGRARGATKWSFAVQPLTGSAAGAGDAGAAIRTAGGVPDANGRVKVAWDGRAGDGSIVPDGAYQVTLRVMDAAGNGPSGRWTVIVDTHAPSVSVAASPALLSPDGDGTADRAIFSWSSTERASGTVRVLHGGRVVRQWTVSPGSSGRIGWNGRDSAGRVAADGRYRVEAVLRDGSGNEAVARTVIGIDRTARSVSWQGAAFDPADGDGLAATARFSFALVRSATTSLRIEDANGNAVRGAWHDRRQAAGTWSWTWDGRAGTTQFVPPGRYVAVLTVVTPFGTTEIRRPIIVDAFTIAMSARSIAAGRTLTLTITATEPLRSPPSVTFSQAGLKPAKMVARSLGGGRYRAAFVVARGGPGIATVVVAGRDVRGGTNRSVTSVTIR